MAAIELNITRSSLQVRHAILSRTPQELAATLADLGKHRELVDRTVADYENGLFTAEGKERFKKLAPLLARFWEVAAANVQLIQAGQKAEAFAFLVDKTIPVRNELLLELDGTVKFQEGMLHQDLNRIESNARNTLQVLEILVIASIAGLGLFSWYLGRVLRQRLDVSREVAERVRDGDLQTPVRDDAQDEFSPLLRALGDMQSSLAGVVSKVRGNAEGVATASAQIAQGNQDLSGRTEQQASALQQTAATMDQLGSTVRNNADNARQANQLAIGASTVATQGGEVVGQVVETMKGINDSSKKIADIISRDRRHRLPDQHPGAECRGGSRPCRRAGPRLCGGGRRGAQPRAAQRRSGARDQVADHRQRGAGGPGHGTGRPGRADHERDRGGHPARDGHRGRDQCRQLGAEQRRQPGRRCSHADGPGHPAERRAGRRSAAASESLKQQAQQLVQAVAVFKLTHAA